MKNLTVKEVLGSISEKSSMASSKDMQKLCIALLSDPTYKTTVHKVVEGGAKVVVARERVLADDFKALVVDVLVKQAKMDKETAEKVAAEYRVTKDFADALLDLQQEFLNLYAGEKGKNTPLVSKDDLQLSLRIDKEPTETTVYRVANAAKGIERAPIYKTKKRKARVVSKTFDAVKIHI